MTGKASINKLIKAHYPQLYARLIIDTRNIGCDALHSDVEDCIQDAFVLLYNQWDRMKDHPNLPSWLHLTVHNNMMNRYHVIMGRSKVTSLSLDADEGCIDYADMCLSVLNDGSIYADQGNVRRAVRVFNRRIADQKSELGTHKGSGMRFGKRAIVVLVVLGCLIVETTVAFALGWLPWIKTVWWDDEQFHYNLTVTEEMAGDPYTQFLPTGLDAALDQALEEYGINIPLPTWIPDGYGDLTFEVVENEGYITVYIEHSKGDNLLRTMVTKYLGVIEVQDSGVIEKDDVYFEEYRKGETAYTIMSNMEWLNAVWMEQPYHCTIGGYVSADEMHRMIDSIYERGQ